MRRIVRLMAVATSIAVIGGVLVAPSAMSAPACPGSLKSLPGGSGDISSNGYDDGQSGDGAAYVGGQILIGLDDSANRAVLDCIAEELGAQIELGEKPKRGMLGLDHLALLQLPPGRSVTKTIDLLNRSKYADIIDFAEPDQYYDTNAITPPNDPMFNLQWGVMNQGWASPSASPYDASTAPRQLAPTATTSMRFAQAWEYMRKSPGVTAANPRGFFDRINVGIIDNSYFEHPELLRNSDLGAGGMVVGFGKGMQIDLKATDRQRFRIVLGTLPRMEKPERPLETCFMQGSDSVDEIASMLTRSVDEMCGYDDVDVWDLVLTGGFSMNVDYGEFELKYGEESVGSFSMTDTSLDIKDALEAKLGVEVSVTAMTVDTLNRVSGVARVVYRILIPSEAPIGVLRAVPVTLQSPDPLIPASAVVERAPQVQVNEIDPVPAEEKAKDPNLQRKLLVTAQLPSYLQGTIKPPFSANPAGMATVSTGSISIKNEENGWPGRNRPTVKDPYGGVHGENIAGMIGAEADNGLGITGAIGKYHNIKMYGLVASSMSTLAIVGAIRTVLERTERNGPDRYDTQVVNLSLGSPNKTDTVFADPAKEDPMKASSIGRAISSAGAHSPTLFVAAAGNEGGNLNDQDLRNRVTYNAEHVVAGDPCRPKGHGVHVAPTRGGENYYYKSLNAKRSGKRSAVTKGGTLNFLKMPDGTYDRGNLLCVGSLDWNGDPSTFTDWGVGVVDVGAPGSHIPGTSANNGYDVGSGTSYSAPLVAAAAALVYSKLRPVNRDPWLVKCALLSSATTQPMRTPTPAQLSALSSAVYAPARDEFARVPASDPRSGYESGPDADQMGPNGEMFTVNGTVNAQLAIKAAQSLARKVNRGERPTCVQKRTWLGGWTNTRTQ